MIESRPDSFSIWIQCPVQVLFWYFSIHWNLIVLETIWILNRKTTHTTYKPWNRFPVAIVTSWLQIKFLCSAITMSVDCKSDFNIQHYTNIYILSKMNLRMLKWRKYFCFEIIYLKKKPEFLKYWNIFFGICYQKKNLVNLILIVIYKNYPILGTISVGCKNHVWMPGAIYKFAFFIINDCAVYLHCPVLLSKFSTAIFNVSFNYFL